MVTLCIFTKKTNKHTFNIFSFTAKISNTWFFLNVIFSPSFLFYYSVIFLHFLQVFFSLKPCIIWGEKTTAAIFSRSFSLIYFFLKKKKKTKQAYLKRKNMLLDGPEVFQESVNCCKIAFFQTQYFLFSLFQYDKLIIISCLNFPRVYLQQI